MAKESPSHRVEFQVSDLKDTDKIKELEISERKSIQSSKSFKHEESDKNAQKSVIEKADH